MINISSLASHSTAAFYFYDVLSANDIKAGIAFNGEEFKGPRTNNMGL